MATKAQRARSDAQRTHGAASRKARVSKKQPKKADWSHEKAHAGTKAAYAFEETVAGERPSRESTRRSANRAKGDTALNLREQAKKGTPTNRARNARAKAGRVRGGGR